MTISLRLDERLAKQLAAAARAKGVSKSELVRQCVTEYLSREQQRPSAWELGESLFGCYDSGRGDLSEKVEQIVRERIRAKADHR